MNSFFSKLKQTHWVIKLFYFFLVVVYFVSFIFFTNSLLHLEGIETTLRIGILIFFGLYGLIYTIIGARKMIKGKKFGFLILSMLAFLFSGVFLFASSSIDRIYTKIENFTSKETSTYTTVILTMKNTEFSSNSTIGMVTDETDRTGYVLPTEWIKKENIDNDIEYYENSIKLMEAFYNGEVDAIFITKDFPVIFGNDERYQNIVNETKVIKEYSKEMKTEESEFLTTTKSLTEPFTILVLGVDSDSTNGLDANAAFNGDTLMLITFNPKTLTATMLSIPRDMYVPIINAAGTSKWYGKINSSAALGTASTVNTVKNITGIDIDYFVKVNFRGVIDLVNTLGGIDVDVEAPNYDYYISIYGEGRLCESDENRDTTNLVCMNSGPQHLNGEQALAYARNRYGYWEGDIARNRHQQQIIEAIAKKLVKTSSLSDFEKLLDTISNNIATNMKTSQILSFYQSIKGMLLNALSGEDFITIQKTQLTYYELNVDGLSCLGYYQGSMDAITEAMKENLGLIKTETIKTFYYDYSEDYEQTSDIIGQGIYTGKKLQSLPNFRGKSVSEAQSFANSNNLSLYIEYKDDPEEIAGIILSQSVSAGTLTNQISSFTIYVNNPTVKPSEPDEPQDNDSTDEPETDDKTTQKPNVKPNDDSKEDDDTLTSDKDTTDDPDIPGNPSVSRDENPDSDSKQD